MGKTGSKKRKRTKLLKSLEKAKAQGDMDGALSAQRALDEMDHAKTRRNLIAELEETAAELDEERSKRKKTSAELDEERSKRKKTSAELDEERSKRKKTSAELEEKTVALDEEIQEKASQSCASVIAKGGGTISMSLYDGSATGPHTKSTYGKGALIESEEITFNNLSWSAFTGDLTAADFDAFRRGDATRQQLDTFSSLKRELKQHSTCHPMKLTYHNEAGVHDCVQSLVIDAVNMLGFARDTAVIRELNTAKVIPDIVISECSTGRALGAIEVKKPGDDVFASVHVAAQILDYLNTLDARGSRPLFGMIHTMNRCVIVWRRFDTAAQALMDAIGVSITALDGAPATPDVVDLVQIDNVHSVMYSQVFDTPVDVARATVLAVWLMHCAQPYPVTRVNLDVSFESRLTRVLDKGVVRWQFKSWTASTTKAPAFPKADASKFFLWDVLGYGATGCVFKASTDASCAVALKVVSQKERRALLSDEARAWSEVYKSSSWPNQVRELARGVGVVTKGKNPVALVMPLFDQLEKELRVDRLDDVKKALKRMARSGWFFDCERNDVAWRHVMLYNGNVVLVDFGDLKRVDPKDRTKRRQLVGKAMQVLKGVTETSPSPHSVALRQMPTSSPEKGEGGSQ